MTKKLTQDEIRQESFESWLSHPLTMALMEKAARIQANCKAKWDAVSWTAPIDELPAKLPTERLAYLRGKSDAFRSLAALKYNDLFKDTANDE
jgi:hypothetical protein